MNAHSQRTIPALKVAQTGSTQDRQTLTRPAGSFLRWLTPHSIVIGITSILGVGAAMALATALHLGITSALIVTASTLLGGLVVLSFLSRFVLPAIDRTIAQQNMRLSKAEQQYRSIFENAVEGIFQTTPNGRYLKANPMLAQIYGYNSPEELVSSLTDIGNQLYIDNTRRDEFKRVLQADDVVLDFDSQVRRRDGQIIWIRENARAIRDSNCQLIGYEGTVLDITTRKQAEDIEANARERERTTAGRIQKALLLADPPYDVSWMEVAVFTQPSQAIDGDFYDFHRYNDSCVDMLIGDVMGKGLPAALLAAGIKSRYLRAVAGLMYNSGGSGLPEPRDIVQEMHADVTPHFIGLEIFATMCHMRFDNAAQKLTFVDCGHTKTIHCTSDGAVQMLESNCLPLGVSLTEVYQQCETPYTRGDTFICYSDGVTEASNPEGEMFGLDRLLDLVRENPGAEPNRWIELITTAVLSHASGTPLGDDLTIVAIKIP